MYIPRAVVVGFLVALGWAAGWLLYGATATSSQAMPSAAATAASPVGARPRAAAGRAVGQPTRFVTGAVRAQARVQRSAPTVSPRLGRAAGPALRNAGPARWASTAGAPGGRATTTRASTLGAVPARQTGVVAVPASSVGTVSPPTRTTTQQTPPTWSAPAGVNTSGPVVPSGQVGAVNASPALQPAVRQSSADRRPAREPAAVQPADVQPAAGQLGSAGLAAAPSAAPAAQRRAAPAGQPRLQIPPFLATPIFTPLPGASSRGVSFMEWESYRLDVAGQDIMVTADDSNVFRDRDGKLNGNTGDTDASGLNVVDASDSVILGTESADEAPWQTRAAMRVDLASSGEAAGADSDAEEAEEAEEAAGSVEATESPEPLRHDATSDTSQTSHATPATDTKRPARPRPPASAGTAVPPATAGGDDDEDADEADTGDTDDDDSESMDFPYHQWVASVRRNRATAVNTDDGTTLASGADALVIGSDGYDDDDVRAAGSNIIITRDDGNVVLGGRGKVNAQIGDSEQGAVIMDVKRTFIKGGGAY
jgi:hypothetical protein